MNEKHFLRSALGAAVLVAAAAGPAAARDFEAQNNEVDVQVDATFAKAGDNDSDVTATYTWFPGAIDKNDEVVPLLRRFVRQPLEIGGRLSRVNDVTDTITGLDGFAEAWLAGIGYGRADLGLEYDSVLNDPPREENAFLAGNVRLEAGVRVLSLLQLGGFYRYRPVLATFPEPNGLIGIVQERSGQTQEVGLGLSVATPEDRLYFQALAGVRDVDWSFTGRYTGDITGRAVFGQARLSLQLSPEFSIFARGQFDQTDWDNERSGQTEHTSDMATGRPAKMTRLDLRADVGIVYWFEGKWGFRLSLGGGYYDKGPLFFQDIESGLARIGVGFTTRY
jgi:hypothetical protein